MIFRNANDYMETEPNEEFEFIINQVEAFCLKLVPTNKATKIKTITKNLSVIIIDKSHTHKILRDGVQHDQTISGNAAHCFWTDINTKAMSAHVGLALRKNASKHVIAHETLHAFSSDIGKTATGGYIKRGSKITTTNDNLGTTERKGHDLNESITDSLASRFCGNVGPNSGASYGAQVLMADLLIGPHLENNLFIQDVYWGTGEIFEKDFDKTIKSKEIKFANYLQDFKILGTPKETLKSDKLLQGAVEYNLRKANTVHQIDAIYEFQQKIINLYKNGGIITGFMEQEDIERLDNLLKFANTTYKTCKLKLANPKSMTPAQHTINYGRK